MKRPDHIIRLYPHYPNVYFNLKTNRFIYDLKAYIQREQRANNHLIEARKKLQS
jgi:hypothetical protein